MNEFLKTRDQITQSSAWLKDNGYINHPLSCKDFELKKVTEDIGDGDLVDLGTDGSFVLHNAIIKGISGRKVGIDLLPVAEGNRAEGAEYFQGDLMNTPFEDQSFDTVICCSVIEHQVDFNKFAKECSRLLREGGKLIVSFDYWVTKIDTSLTKLYSLDWNILDSFDVQMLISQLRFYGLFIDGEMDWTVHDAVINPSYCSPAQGVSYTFGILKFKKV